MKSVVFSLLSLIVLTGCIGDKSEDSSSDGQGPGISQLIAPALPAVPVLAVDKIFPTEFESIDAKLGFNQTIESLNVQDQSGYSQDWLNYVEFEAQDNFVGVFKFDLGRNITEVKSLKLKFNYLGTNLQVWKFSLKDITTGEWVDVGDNSSITPWVWSEVTVEINNPEKFVNLTGKMELKYSSNFAPDALVKEKSYLDYLELELGSL